MLCISFRAQFAKRGESPAISSAWSLSAKRAATPSRDALSCLVVLPPGGFFAVEPQREALRATTGLQKLIQLHFNRAVAGTHEVRVHSRAAAVVNYRLADHHRVAAEPERLVFAHGNQFR